MDERVIALLKAGRVNEARVLHRGEIPQVDFAADLAKERFQHQNSFGPHHAFDNCGNDWKGYFFTQDALHNTQDDVVFSILDRYKCELGCKTCYLNGYWMNEKEFAPWVPKTLDERTEETFLKVFDHFYRVGSIDDLRLIQTKYPHLFEFFKRNAPRMEHNITDNGLFAQYEILMNECHFGYTAYLSFSDFLLDKGDGEMVDRIIPKLERLHDRSPIRKINFIMSRGLATQNPNVMRLFDWVVGHTNIETFFHTDLCKPQDNVADLKTMYGYDLPSIYYQENAYDPPVVCQILTETIHMRGRSFFTTLTGSTIAPTGDRRIADPFYTIDEWDAGKFLAGLVKGKIATYDYYQEVMTQKRDNRYWEYFRWCRDHLVVNDDFTFIPATMLRPWTAMHKRLEANGWTNTYAGLIRTGAQKVIPLVSVR